MPSIGPIYLLWVPLKEKRKGKRDYLKNPVGLNERTVDNRNEELSKGKYMANYKS
jgi:hypothetical protein